MREIVVIGLVLVLTGGLGRAADAPVATTSLSIRNRPEPEDPSARKLTWSAKDPSVVAGERGTVDDPRCIGAGGGGAGGSLRVFSDRSTSSTEDTGDLALPCANWKATGRDTNPTGFVYTDIEQSDGPCRRVVVTSGRGVKATCTGKHAPLDYDLMTGVDQGNVGIVLRVGLDDRHCGSVDATNGKDGSDGHTFQGRHAAAPAACPVPFVCGDAHVVPGEQCDDGNLAIGDGCDASCRIEDGYACTGEPSACALICSDGNVDAGETCDDGNLTNGDGCDATCQVEGHYTCDGEPNVCTPVCGDGLIVGGEECDDGGTSAGDGCSDTCAIEAGYACAGAPSVCTSGCGDGTVAGSEQCDDANATAGDGCTVHCAYEPLCLVTRDAGNPSHASLTKIAPDGSVTPMTGVTLPGNDPRTTSTLARCGRRVYFNLGSAIAGLEVGLDGTLTPLPTFTLTDQFQIDFIDRIVCSPVQDLVMTFESAGLFNGEVTSYRVDGTTGALTQAGRTTTFGSTFGRYNVDFHPVTHEAFFTVQYDPPLGATPLTVTVGRIAYDAAGNLSVPQQYTMNSGPFTPTTIDGLRFTGDAGILALFSFFDGSQTCFGQFNAPGTSFPPLSALEKTCSGPVPTTWRTFVPRPEGGSLAYYQGGDVTTAQFVGTTITTVSSTPAQNGAARLLTTFDGRRLIGLGDGTVATYDIASDLVTVTPNDVEPIGASPVDGVLLACPGL
jgi:cysteine-rich repeat protein